MRTPVWAHLGDAAIALIILLIALVDVKWAVVIYLALDVLSALFKALTEFLRPIIASRISTRESR